MRQFAPSTISRWVDDRLYFDANDELTRPEPLTQVRAMRKTVSDPLGREGCSEELKSPKLYSREIEYVIEVLVKEYSEEVMEQLRRTLATYRYVSFHLGLKLLGAQPRGKSASDVVRSPRADRKLRISFQKQ